MTLAQVQRAYSGKGRPPTPQLGASCPRAFGPGVYLAGPFRGPTCGPFGVRATTRITYRVYMGLGCSSPALSLGSGIALFVVIHGTSHGA